MPRHPDIGPPWGRSAWALEAMLLCWIVGALVIVVQGMNLIHVVSLVHESSEGYYSGTSPRLRDVPTEHYSGSDISLIPPGLICHYGEESLGMQVILVNLTPWSPLIFWSGTALLVACLTGGLWLRRLRQAQQDPWNG